MSGMGGYERDEYENLDEYEDECGEDEYEEDGDEYEYEEEQVHQPSAEELEYLAMRQQLKERIRKQMNKELGTANGGSRNKTNASRKDNYGSFFGPSQPVIAPRVIQESKSLLENPNLAARISKQNPTTNNKNRVSTTSTGSKPRANPPKAINGLKKKVELIKDTRDYSFLLSEDTEIPPPTKTPQRNVSAPKSDARSAQLLAKSKQVSNDRGRDASNNRNDRGRDVSNNRNDRGRDASNNRNDRGRDVSNNRDGRKPIVSNGQIRPKVGSSSSSKLPIDHRKQLGSNNASGPGRPVGSQGGPSRSVVSDAGKKVMNSGGKTRPPGSVPKPMSAVQHQMRKPATSHLQSGVNRPLQSSVSRNTSVQRMVNQETNRPRSSLPSSRDEVRRIPAKIPSHGAVSERPKPKPGKRPSEYDDESRRALSELRNMFRSRGYDPSKYHDDDDDSDMEAGFDDILREEKRSARIARQEDEEEARLLEEEERRRMARKRKMGH